MKPRSSDHRNWFPVVHFEEKYKPSIGRSTVSVGSMCLTLNPYWKIGLSSSQVNPVSNSLEMAAVIVHPFKWAEVCFLGSFFFKCLAANVAQVTILFRTL